MNEAIQATHMKTDLNPIVLSSEMNKIADNKKHIPQKNQIFLFALKDFIESPPKINTIFRI